MRRGTAAGLHALAALTITLGAGCTQVVAPGAGVAAPDTAAAGPGRAGAATPAAPSSGLDADVLADECLLDARELRALVGVAVQAPEQGVVQRRDGSPGTSCYADTAAEPPTTVVAINVYLPRSGTPAEFVRAAGPGRRALGGTGQAAAIVDIHGGTTLQLAGARHLVTITVLDGPTPSDDAWRAAATSALARLPA